MNLTTDPWIPVLRIDGRLEEVGLLRAFTEGREIADLSVRPHERIALMRLLICVGQAALDGPEDEDAWHECRRELPSRVADYLSRWHHKFELFGEGPRFLQAKGKGSPGEMSVNKLQFIDKDTSTLFDNEVEETNERSGRWLAIALLTYQSFAAGGKVGGAEVVGGRKVPQSGTNAPCRDQNGLHAFVRKASLLDTIHANLLHRQALEERGLKPLVWGKKPVWEYDAEALSLAEVRQELAGSYLGRLAPLSRAVWLRPDHRTASNANGLSFGNFAESGYREPSCSITKVQDKKTGQPAYRLVSARGDAMGRAVWRQLGAILLKRKATDHAAGAACIYGAPAGGFDLWVGALVADQAKVIDAIESVYSIPAAIVSGDGIRIYEGGVQFADALSMKLAAAVKGFRLAAEKAALNRQQQIGKAAKLPRAERDRYSGLVEDAALHYWTAAEHLVPELFRLLADPPPVENARHQFAGTTWGKGLFHAALEAYELTCPHDTPRQLQAYVLGRGQLVRPLSEPEPNEETEEQTA